MLPGKVERGAQGWEGVVSEGCPWSACVSPEPRREGQRMLLSPLSSLQPPASSPARPAKHLFIRSGKDAGQRGLKIHSRFLQEAWCLALALLGARSGLSVHRILQRPAGWHPDQAIPALIWGISSSEERNIPGAGLG